MSSVPLVLVVVPWGLDQPGGVSQVAANLVAEARQEPRVEIAALLRDHAFSTPVESVVDGTRTFRSRLAAPWYPKRPLRSLLALPVSFVPNVVRLIRILRGLRPALVNIHYPSLASWSLLLATRVAAPSARVVLSFHGADLNACESRHPLDRFLWRYLVRASDGVTCCSAALAQRFSAAFAKAKVPGAPVVIHNGLDSRRLADEFVRGALPASLDGVDYVLNVATFEHKKGQDILIRAFAGLVQQHPALRLVIAGRTTPFLAEIKQLVEELGLADAVVLLTDVKHADVLHLFERARVFALSSRVEPFGIVLLEAGHLGVPVVASATGGVPEIVEHGVTGLLVEPGDIEQLRSSISTLLGDGAQARRMASAARVRVARDFSWRAAFERYLATGGVRLAPDGHGHSADPHA